MSRLPFRWGDYRGVGLCFASNLPFIASFLRRGNQPLGVRENLAGTRTPEEAAYGLARELLPAALTASHLTRTIRMKASISS